MSTKVVSADYQIKKHRVRATVQMTSGEAVDGYFFAASGFSHRAGPERVIDLLNGESGFFPFEARAPKRVILFNRAHVVTVGLSTNDAKLEPGHEGATSCDVTIRFTTGARLEGTIRIYRPEGYARLSDWTRQPDLFQHVEVGDTTTIVNASHILEISELSAD